MGWLNKWVFGPKESATQHAKKPEKKPKENPKEKHVGKVLAFAKTRHRSLKMDKYEKERWDREHSSKRSEELSALGGVEFEEYLASLFKKLGYDVELTPVTGDYGADLIILKSGRRIAVQAKCYTGSVGVSSVQEALSGKAYYRCDQAWVVTTGNYTANAIHLAEKSDVKMIGKSELGKLIIKTQIEK